MITIDSTEVSGWQSAVRGMRNPKNSWNRSDSSSSTIGPNDMKLATTLAKAGTEHRKFLRMVHVQMDVNAPLYWWKEFDTYKIGTTSDSCSTMHKLDSRDLSISDFSTDHMIPESLLSIEQTISAINGFRASFVKTKNKVYWWQMIQLLPSSYNQRRTIDVDYETLLNIHRQRKNHKLDEWHVFCSWIESLPYMDSLLEVTE